jgi:hypothetical protein
MHTCMYGDQHPCVFVHSILSKLQEKGSGREAHWATLLTRKLFTSPHDTGSSSLQHLVGRLVSEFRENEFVTNFSASACMSLKD